MKIHDTITADQIEVGDLIVIPIDNPIEVSAVIDEGDAIFITGFSYETGDTDRFVLRPEDTVGLWTADDE